MHLVHYLIVLFITCFGFVYCFALVKSYNYFVCYEELSLNWFISDALFSFLIPFTIIAVLNVMIILHLRKGFQYNQHYRFSQRKPSEWLPLNLRKKFSSSNDMETSMQTQARIYESESMPSVRVRSGNVYLIGDESGVS